MKITREKLYELYSGISKCLDIPGEKFAYAILKNKKMVDSAIRSHEDSYQEKQDFLDFQKEMKELVRSHAKKNELGEYEVKDAIEGGRIVKQYVVEDQELLDKEAVELKKKHAKAIKSREKQMKDFQKSLGEEIYIEIHKIKKSEVPTTITANQLEGIMDLIHG